MTPDKKQELGEIAFNIFWDKLETKSWNYFNLRPIIQEAWAEVGLVLYNKGKEDTHAECSIKSGDDEISLCPRE